MQEAIELERKTSVASPQGEEKPAYRSPPKNLSKGLNWRGTGIDLARLI